MRRSFVLGIALVTTLTSSAVFVAGESQNRRGHDPHRPAAAVAQLQNVGPQRRQPSAAATVVRTFAELEAQINDPNGASEIELVSGVYKGDLDIRRSVTIRGAYDTVIEGTGTSTVIKIDGSDVVLENLNIRHSGHKHTTEDSGVKATGQRVRIAQVRVEDTLFGISLEACKSCAIERVHVVGFGDDAELRGDGVKLWEANDSVVRGSLVEHARDLVVWYTRRATLEDNVVIGGRYGSHFMYAHDSTVQRSHFEKNVVGIFVMYSVRIKVEENVLAGARGAAGIGLGFKDSDAVEVRRNWLIANTVGTYLDNTPRTAVEPVIYDENVIALNDVAMKLNTAESGLVFSANDFHQNADTISVDGGGDALFVAMRGNHFSDYEGYDLDNDGIGDVAYEVKALSSELTESRPVLKFFQGSVAMGLVDVVARAMPILASHKLLIDPAPLARRPQRQIPAPRQP